MCLRWPDAHEMLAPYLGLGDRLGLPPLSSAEIRAATDDAPYRHRYLLDMITPLGRLVGAPEQLRLAVADATSAGVIGVLQLSDLWVERERTDGRLHPEGLRRIAVLFGVPTPWAVRTVPEPHRQFVIANQLRDTFDAQARTLREAIHKQRLVDLRHLDQVLPDLTQRERVGLVEGFGWLAADRQHAVDTSPRNVDLGLGRALASARGSALPVPILSEARRRWSMEGNVSSAAWDDYRRLELYLELSPLYARQIDGWTAAGEWASTTPADDHTLKMLEALGGRATFRELAAALEVDGLGHDTAEHRLAVSPVIYAVRRGMYASLAG